MIKRIISVLTVLSLLFMQAPAYLFAQEAISMTAVYPAEYGAYGNVSTQQTYIKNKLELGAFESGDAAHSIDTLTVGGALNAVLPQFKAKQAEVGGPTASLQAKFRLRVM